MIYYLNSVVVVNDHRIDKRVQVPASILWWKKMKSPETFKTYLFHCKNAQQGSFQNGELLLHTT